MKGQSVGGGIASAFAVIAGSASAAAQDLPSDVQVQAAFGLSYDRLGLIEYCAAKGFATSEDVVNAQKMVAATTVGMSVGLAAKALEAVGRRGDIVGEQVIGLLDAANPARPEIVRAGKTMSLADNAQAQGTTERSLCGQIVSQLEPLP